MLFSVLRTPPPLPHSHLGSCSSMTAVSGLQLRENFPSLPSPYRMPLQIRVSQPTLGGFGFGWFFVEGAFLCTLGCWAASLTYHTTTRCQEHPSSIVTTIKILRHWPVSPAEKNRSHWELSPCFVFFSKHIKLSELRIFIFHLLVLWLQPPLPNSLLQQVGPSLSHCTMFISSPHCAWPRGGPI